jgi:cell wall-associated NlpC family hydrolase
MEDFTPRIITGMDIVREARALLGVRYRHAGETESGLDCSGLIVCVGKRTSQIPAELRRPAYSAIRPNPRHFLLMKRWGDEIAVGEEQPGDVILMAHGSDYTKVQHVALRAVYEPTNTPTLIHIHPGSSIARVTEHSIDAEWQRRILGVLRWKGVRESWA